MKTSARLSVTPASHAAEAGLGAWPLSPAQRSAPAPHSPLSARTFFPRSSEKTIMNFPMPLPRAASAAGDCGGGLGERRGVRRA